MEFEYQEIFEHGADTTTYRTLTSDHVSTTVFEGQEILTVQPEALTLLAREAMDDVAHLLRTNHLKQLSDILDDPEASDNDRFVALELLKNANIAAGRVLPGCQDTGTAIAVGYKGQQVFTTGNDAETISRGIYEAYEQRHLRYSQMAPLDMYTEQNTGTNLPAQIELYADSGEEYRFLFIAKGGGSANKTFLYQETRALLNPKSLLSFVAEKIRTIGTSACPPYHLAIVIGGLSAEFTLKTVKLASCHYLDDLPTSGNHLGRAFRDLDFEKDILRLCVETASAPNSAANISHTTYGSFASLVMVRPAPWAWVSPARPTGKSSAKSPKTESFSNNSKRIPRNTSRTSVKRTWTRRSSRST